MLKETTLRELGEDLRCMRKEMGMTLEALTAELGTDFRVISRYENGQAEMGAVMYRKLQLLYEQKTYRGSLFQQIQQLAPADRMTVETIVSRLGRR